MDFLKYLNLVIALLAKTVSFLSLIVFSIQAKENPHSVGKQRVVGSRQSGVVLADVVHGFTGAKLNVNTPSSLDDKSAMPNNLSLVLGAMKNDGVDLMNNNIGDICNGKPKIVLGLIWQMILHYDIRKSIQHH
uniref:Calponin-homology (CH) domain-containing protein n=1 Tax=Strongyloides papillosus TaxID=174720 RepID=A0A0N5C3Z6_STREA